MRVILVSLLVLVAVWYGVVRFWPGNPEVWHIDPIEAPDPGIGGVRVAGEEAPFFAGQPAAVLEAFHVAILQEGGRVFAGRVEEGFVTYLSQTRIFKFPDYVTVRVEPEDDGTRLSYRALTGTKGGDGGTNAERMERLMKATRDRLP